MEGPDPCRLHRRAGHGGGRRRHSAGVVFSEINKVLSAYDVRIISDEVICGFGRTGEWFGAQSLGFQPTSISVAKAITSGYFPLGAITIEEPLYQAMLRESEKIGVFGHGFTYTGHPVGCAIALKTIEIYQRERFWTASRLAPVFAERLRRLGQHELVGNARSIGLIGGIELVADRKARRFSIRKRVSAPVASANARSSA